VVTVVDEEIKKQLGEEVLRVEGELRKTWPSLLIAYDFTAKGTTSEGIPIEGDKYISWRF
jgi:hypothetical protein